MAERDDILAMLVQARDEDGGTMILTTAWGLHHDPDRYPDPDRFVPERFLDGASDSYDRRPFGGGAHRSIGSALAELEIRIALTTLLRTADLPSHRGRGESAQRGSAGGSPVTASVRWAQATSCQAPSL